MSDSFKITGIKKFQRQLNRLSKITNDLRPLFEKLASDHYKEEKKIFNLKRRGKYEDLSKKYKKLKKRNYGSAYPIFVGKTKNLKKSLLNRSDENAVFDITKTKATIGTNVPYAKYHHSKKLPRTKLPRRPLWFVGEENPTQFKRWVRTAENFIRKAAIGAFR